MEKERKLRILLLEEAEEVEELVALELCRGGIKFTMKRVWTRDALLCELEEYCPELIIADYTLPSYAGLSALADVRQRSEHIPFIILSGTAGVELAIESLQRGATDYVLKDHMTRLAPAVVRAMQEYEERRERREAAEACSESEKMFRALAVSVQDAIIMLDMAGKVSYWNEAANRIFGYAANEVIGMELQMFLAPCEFIDDYHEGLVHFGQSGECPGIGKLFELCAFKQDGTEFPAEFSVSVLKLKDGWHAVITLRDITERKIAQDMLQHQLENMTALSIIETAISSSLDLRVTLNVLLEKLLARLGADAAAVLLLDPTSLYLNYSAGLGFKTDAIKNTMVRLGKGYAGQAAFERRSIIVADFAGSSTHALGEEGFESYIAMPLIAQGKIKGVLEIFHRKPVTPPPEWLALLEFISGQAAITLDNVTMFDNLQRANLELTLSYDITLEGWGRTLEMRDEDTKGHTERVADRAVRLARLMGLEDHELVNVRRGALLHDIGKLSIPDSILLKPDALTREETEIMMLHPVHAYNLLSGIPFLRSAIDIPYCHHEKWDGGGYPLRLKGEHIPYKARIFSVVDVADALISARPYRPAWPEGKVYEYIEAQKGIHFDPAVVDAFMEMRWS